ncbi:WD repeat-containing protein 34 [Elysia marginata]|uniref:WD repeat-containing protein 34 n=1 Tax=Elysia marginata TaxID=1093978 RepID=A0AAV4EBX4_9GAST|nr:WD repeat-containing protein 34 [Elysia marginata]
MTGASRKRNIDAMDERMGASKLSLVGPQASEFQIGLQTLCRARYCKSVAEQGCQTRDVYTNSVEVQSHETFEQEVQTDYGGDSYKLDGTYSDNQALADFLQRVEPMVLQCLNRNLKSKAFDGILDQRDSGLETVTCMHTLYSADLKEKMQVTDLSWNATGSTLAATYPL